MKSFPIKPFTPRGITLTEVLISMGVMTFGLLGVAALFPVGGHYLRQGVISDRADALAAGALNDAIARGMLDPANWLAMEYNGAVVDQGRFDRPFQSALAQQLSDRSRAIAASSGNTQTVWLRNRLLNGHIGSAFAIDPYAIAAAQNPADGRVGQSLSSFPASQNWSTFFTSRGASPPIPGEPSWHPWVGFGKNWPLQRITVTPHGSQRGNRPLAPSLLEAENMVMASDDLAQEFGEDADAPSQQQLFFQDSLPYTREFRGDYSYMLTVVPTTPESRTALASDPASHYYDVSAVVFYKRVLGETFESGAADHLPTLTGERLVRAAVVTEGIGGGQLTLFSARSAQIEHPALQNAESPLEKLRGGGWIMLVGPHPASTNQRPYLFAQWYRVIAKESTGDLDGDGREDADVFVTGPDWPWPALENPVSPSNYLANPGTRVPLDLRAIIVPDVASVHTRTMKLQPGTQWNRRN